MRHIKNTTTMINKLNDAFEGLRAQNESYFTGDPCPSEGIWLKGLHDISYQDFDRAWELAGGQVPEGYESINSKVEDFLEVRGWVTQPYDGGTTMAYRA